MSMRGVFLGGMAALALLSGTMTRAGPLSFQAISFAGQRVDGHYEFEPSVLSSVLIFVEGAGTLHELLHGQSLVSPPRPDEPQYGGAWYVAELGNAPFVETNGSGPPSEAIDLVVDRYKDADGASRLRLIFNSYTGYGHYAFLSTLTLNYGCDCSALYDEVLTSALLVGRPVLSGVAFNQESYSDVWNEQGSWHTEREVAFAVSEPSTGVLGLTGVALMAWIYSRQVRRRQE